MLEGNDPQRSLIGATLGNYQVTGRIGAGGMGVVYRAKDVRLDRTVAVKALPESRGSDPVARRKLMDEARRASRVVSPYVATVFDVVEQDDSAYIVMEHIEGRRLDDVLREDKPDLSRVTGFAVEIAEALGAIHDAGLVHRDLKPANVMVTPAGHVKVMDFGLARDDAAKLLLHASSDSTQSTETTPGAIAGTVLYMSPEQLRGAPLDARTDLFSFGTLLYEAVNGKHPFVRESLLASASAILHEVPHEDAPSPKAGSSPIAPIIHRLLEKDREKRYPSATAVLDDLRAVKSGSVGSRLLPSPRRKLYRSLAVAGALAGLVLTGYALWPSRPPSGAEEARPALAVLPFEDRTGEPRGDLRAQLLADVLATDLSESTLVRSLPSDRVREILLGLDARAPLASVLAAVAKASNVRWIVAGTLYKEGDALYASVGVYQPGQNEPFVSFRAAAGTTASIAEVAGAKLREGLFPDRNDVRSADLSGAEGGAISEESQLLVQAAKQAVREQRYGEAIEKLDKAVHLDPGFLRAQVRLAEVLDRAGYAARAQETADRALRTAEQLGPAAEGASLVLDARAVHARIHGDADAELAARRSLMERRSDDPTTHLELARALDRRGRPADALPEAGMAIALDPKDPGAHLTMARLLSKAKRFDDAASSFDRAEALFAEFGSTVGHATVERARGDVEYARAHYPQAEPHYQTAARELAAAGLDMLAAQSRKGAGDCQLMQGNLGAAVAIYEPVLALARSAGDHRTIVTTLASLGGQYRVQGSFELAERALREAREDAKGLGNPRLLSVPTLNLASVLSATGRVGESRALAEESLALSREAGDREIQAKSLLLLANGLYWEGRLDEAMNNYREVRDSPSLANASGNPLGSAHLGLAQILRESGRLKEAAESAERAVEVNRAANQRVLLGNALVARASVRSELLLEAGAAVDLDEATKLASDPPPPLQDLLESLRFGRAALAAKRGRWDDAERALAKLREGMGAERAAGVSASTLGLSAQVAFERGRVEDALRYARGAISSPTCAPVDRLRARVELARACARSGKKTEASSEARRALDEADRMGVPVVTALACAVLVGLGEGADTESIRARGRAALERYLDAAPEERRAALRAGHEVKAMVRAFGEHEGAVQSR
jgi:serine/threonine protein kinase/tetratricopeptide (TPR) repeat protein